MTSQNLKYLTSFKLVGDLYDETLLLLTQYHLHRDWETVKSKTLDENLLNKNSTRRIKEILNAVMRRIIMDHSPLPNANNVANFISSAAPKQSKIQVLYQYICNFDPLIDRLMLELVAPYLQRYSTFRLTKMIYEDFMATEAKKHSELKKWTPQVHEKWRRGFFSFLRSSGFMEKAPSVVVTKPIIRIEAFTFFLYGLLDQGFVASEIINNNNQLWKRYFLNSSEVEALLSDAQEKGWVNFIHSGSIIELKPNYKSLEDWLNGALG